MSNLIKLGKNGPKIGRFKQTVHKQPIVQPHELKINEQAEEIEKLNELILKLQKEIEQTKTNSYDLGYEEGLNAAKLNHTELQKKSIHTLNKATETALNQFANSMKIIENSALLIVRRTLEKLFGNDNEFHNILEAVIRQQVRQLQSGLILSFRLCPDDFNTLDKTLANLNSEEIEIFSDPMLSKGECHIDLVAGQIELSLENYWQTIQTLLNSSDNEPDDSPSELELDLPDEVEVTIEA